jgi:CheY-like chemotaxis protein
MAEAPQALRPSILALIDDLFFALKIEETAKHLDVPLSLVADATEFLARFTGTPPALVVADLTMTSVDMTAVLEQCTAESQPASVPVLGYTTHADWKRTGPLHGKCTMVVTKDTLARRLPELIQQLLERR